MKVLSLFDGMGCGAYALKQAGIKPSLYMASEIDKYAIAVAKFNHPEIVHVGCVKALRKLADAGMLGWFDLVIAGSPCQGFSFSGEQLAFNDPRSILFFEFLFILWALKAVNPDIKFMLENVRMKKKSLDVITNFLGVQPVLINSALVSAQNRERYYWANFPITQPQDEGILLKDIIETGEVERDKSYCIDANYYKGASTQKTIEKKEAGLPLYQSEKRLMVKEIQPLSEGELNYMNRKTKDGRNHWDFGHHSDTANEKSAAVVANFCRGVPYNVLIDREITGGAIRGRYIEGDSGETQQGLEIRADGKANALTTVGKDSVLIVPEATKKGYAEIPPNCGVDLTYPTSKTRRGRKMQNKSNCLTAATYNYNWYNGITYRKFTITECERLQTLPDGYTRRGGGGLIISASQSYKMLGNGWNAKTITHIFRGMPR